MEQMINYINRLFKKWQVVYPFRTLPCMVMSYRFMKDAEKDALFIGFKLMNRKKMVVNYSEKTITIS